jgi:UDP-glucose 4-epimerase
MFHEYFSSSFWLEVAMHLKATVLGAGFIGVSFLRHAFTQGYELTVLDHKSVPDEFTGRLSWLVGDLSDEALVERALSGVETVFHFISSTVPGDQINMATELQQNVFQTLQLLNLCVRQNVRRVIFISSSSVYGIQKNLPIPETAPTDPISAHGIHKLTIEKYLHLYRHMHGLDCKILRLSNPYGPGQSLTGRQGFVAIAIGNIVAGRPVMIRGDGGAVRDFVYIDDVFRVLHKMAITTSAETVFNFGSGHGHTLKGVVEKIEQIIGYPVPVAYVESRFADISESILDISKAKKVLNVSPEVTLDEGLSRTLSYHGLI